MNYIIDFYLAIFALFATMFGFGLVNALVDKQATLYSYWNFGKLRLFISSFIGTTVHELSHAFFVVLFGNDIKDFRLFPKLSDINSGKPLGYVQYSYRKNFIGSLSLFFIGIGPILGGPLIILVLLKLLLPTVYMDVFNSIITNIGENQNIFILLKDTIFIFFKNCLNIEILGDFKFYIFLLLAGSIACHVTLSWADIKGAYKGLVFVLILLTIVCFLGLFIPLLGVKILELIFIITSFLSLLWIISFIFILFTFLFNYLIHYIIR